jgi:hypothetical protein
MRIYIAAHPDATKIEAREKPAAKDARVCGAVKVKCPLMFSILVLTADQLVRLVKPDPFQPDPGQTQKRSQKFGRLENLEF